MSESTSTAPLSLPSSSTLATTATVVVNPPSEPSPTTSSNTSATQQFYKPRARSISNATARSRSNSVVSVNRHPPPPGGGGTSLTSPPPSATHTGSILPPASFFRPSRPPYVPPTPSQQRPASVVSATSSGAPLVRRHPETFHLAPLSKELSRGSEFSANTGDDRGQPGLMEIAGSGAKTKPSREVLLPIRERSNGKGSSEGSPSGGVRGSLERMFKRTTSTDSVRREPAQQLNIYPTHQEEPSPPILAKEQRPPSRHTHFAPLPPRAPKVIPSKARLRNYQVHPSRNTFLLNGRLVTGGDSPLPFLGSMTVMLAIAGIWFGSPCIWWWRNESPAVAAVGAYMTLLTLASFFATAFRDPGILPRNLDIDPPYPATSPSDGSPRAPLPRDLRVRSGVVRVKYCPTCKTYRPPRSSHCKMCDNCVDGCDHHCQWVNNCVGRRNYTFFITFLVSSSLTLILVLVTSALHLYFLSIRETHNFRHALQRAPASAVVFGMGIAVIWPLLALLFYHVRLLLLNISTIEQIRNQTHASLVPGPAPPNPFTLGKWHRNLAYLLCRPAGYSWLNPRGFIEEDRREPNPGAWKGDEEVGWRRD